MRMLVMIGVPASGKSTFRRQILSRAHLNGSDQYAVVSSDDEIELEAAQRQISYSQVFAEKSLVNACMNRAEMKFKQALNQKKFILLDRTNLTVKSRANYIEQAKAKGYSVDAVVFELPMTDAAHNEWNNRLDGREGKVIPASVLQDMFCNYQDPTLEEGFDNILRVNTF